MSSNVIYEFNSLFVLPNMLIYFANFNEMVLFDEFFDRYRIL